MQPRAPISEGGKQQSNTQAGCENHRLHRLPFRLPALDDQRPLAVHCPPLPLMMHPNASGMLALGVPNADVLVIAIAVPARGKEDRRDVSAPG